ncbi:MAG: homoserine dehydrogenase [Desulfovibrionales bacterium]|nr:homoserine dehydrogenase [Desulfovibrionales bacterium]
MGGNMNSLRIGLAGLGTVGGGLASILQKNGNWVENRLGRPVSIKTVLVRDPSKKRNLAQDSGIRITTDPSDIVDDPDIDIVVELMGGIDAPKNLIARALNAGKHVVTANKALLAEQGEELFQLASEKGLGLYFEASVAGGVPIVQTIKESLACNRIPRLLGILNGTANFVLSQMTTQSVEFGEALAEAQRLGYAEADPSLDIDGGDAAHKLCLLIRLAYGVHFPYEKLHVQGIRAVTRQDIAVAREFGYRIKLIAQVNEVDGRLEAGVLPALVHHTYLLARVGGNYNAVRVEGDCVGSVMLHGQGAGALPTASAVLADIMALARANRAPDNTGFADWRLPEASVINHEDARAEHYFRFTVDDRPGVMAAIAQAMADNNISIAQAVQKGEAMERCVPIVFLTHESSISDVDRAVRAIDAMEFIQEPTVAFRIL